MVLLWKFLTIYFSIMEDARWIMEDGRWKMDNMRDRICIMEDGRLKMEDGRWIMKDERWKTEDGRWKMEDGRWKMEDGRWKMAKENRFYIKWNLLEKKCKTAILLYCFHTAGVHLFFITFWALEHHFIEKFYWNFFLIFSKSILW